MIGAVSWVHGIFLGSEILYHQRVDMLYGLARLTEDDRIILCERIQRALLSSSAFAAVGLFSSCEENPDRQDECVKYVRPFVFLLFGY